MPHIPIHAENESYTNISNNFIEYYMPDANDAFVKLYIYLAFLCSAKKGFSTSDLADHLHCNENDVMRGIEYWISKDAISIAYDENHSVIGITLLSLRKPKNNTYNFLFSKSVDAAAQNDMSSDIKTKYAKKDIKSIPADKSSENINYDTDITAGDDVNENINNTENDILVPDNVPPSREKLNAVLSDPDISSLIQQAAVYFKRTPSQTDINALIYIHDDLKLSMDLCEYLLEYCASIKKTNSRYFQAVAVTWFKKGITDRETAELFSERYFGPYSHIIKALGITDRYLAAPVERDYIDRWIEKYGFSEQIILEACKRAVLNNKASFPYVEGILCSWNKKGVHRFDDIVKSDGEHKAEMQSAKKNEHSKSSIAHSAASSRNSADFPQKDMSKDLDEIVNLYAQKYKRKDDD